MLLEMLVKSIGLPHKVLPNVGSCVPVTPALHPPTPSITDVHMDFITPHPLSSLVAGQRLPVVDVSTFPVALCIEMFSERVVSRRVVSTHWIGGSGEGTGKSTDSAHNPGDYLCIISNKTPPEECELIHFTRCKENVL